MKTGFVDSIKSVDGGRIKVEHRDLGIRVGQVDMGQPPKAVNHTMETDHIDISWGNGAAHFAIGNHLGASRPQLQQTIPLGWMATALANPSGDGKETNRWVRLQVENAWFSSRDPYLPSKEEQVLWASLAEFAQQELGIPEKRAWPDKLPDGIIASTEFSRRHSRWPNVAGWYKHAEIHGNHHWDDGSMRTNVLLKQEVEPAMTFAYTAIVTWRTTGEDPHRERRELSPHFEKWRDLEDWLAKDDDQLRKAVREHLFNAGKPRGHALHIAHRKIDADKVRG